MDSLEGIQMKVVAVGDSSVGKTCISKRIVSDTFQGSSSSTLGAAYLSTAVDIDDKTVLLQLWDTAGQEKFRGMTPVYFRNAKTAFVVYSVDNKETFNDVDDWISMIKEHGPSNVDVVLVGNKSDLEEHRQVSTIEGSDKAERNNIKFFEVSAKSGRGIQQLMQNICRDYINKLKNLKNKKDEEAKSLVSNEVESENPAIKKAACC